MESRKKTSPHNFNSKNNQVTRHMSSRKVLCFETPCGLPWLGLLPRPVKGVWANAWNEAHCAECAHRAAVTSRLFGPNDCVAVRTDRAETYRTCASAVLREKTRLSKLSKNRDLPFRAAIVGGPSAPILPVEKGSRPDGIPYMHHTLLPTHPCIPSDISNEDLVVLQHILDKYIPRAHNSMMRLHHFLSFYRNVQGRSRDSVRQYIRWLHTSNNEEDALKDVLEYRSACAADKLCTCVAIVMRSFRKHGRRMTSFRRRTERKNCPFMDNIMYTLQACTRGSTHKEHEHEHEHEQRQEDDTALSVRCTMLPKRFTVCIATLYQAVHLYGATALPGVLSLDQAEGRSPYHFVGPRRRTPTIRDVVCAVKDGRIRSLEVRAEDAVPSYIGWTSHPSMFNVPYLWAFDNMDTTRFHGWVPVTGVLTDDTCGKEYPNLCFLFLRGSAQSAWATRPRNCIASCFLRDDAIHSDIVCLYNTFVPIGLPEEGVGDLAFGIGTATRGTRGSSALVHPMRLRIDGHVVVVREWGRPHAAPVVAAPVAAAPVAAACEDEQNETRNGGRLWRRRSCSF